MFICFNGDFFPADRPVLTAQNRSFKWGDGLFETIKLRRNQILLAELHFERLFKGLALLQISSPPGFNKKNLSDKMLALCGENNCGELARIRLAVFRNEQGAASYLLEAVALDPSSDQWSDQGLVVDIYPFARKPRDAFANLKSANYLPYLMAGEHAQQSGWDDALVMNTDDRLCDSSKANLFLIKYGEFITPSPDQGCIRGVMRQHLIGWLRSQNYVVHEQPVSIADLESADEAFLTNAIMNIRWIRSFRRKQFGSAISAEIYRKWRQTI